MNDQLISLALPDIETIKSYTGKELAQDLKKYEDRDYDFDHSSKIYQTITYIAYKISTGRQFLGQEFREYKDPENSGIMMGSVHVPNGAIAITSLAMKSGLLPTTSENGITRFEIKEILDKLTPEDKVGGSIGGYLRRSMTRYIIKEYESSGFVQISERIRQRFKDELNNPPFVFDETIGEYWLESQNHCEGVETGSSLDNIVNRVSLWHGNNNVIRTPDIIKLLISAYCFNTERVEFEKLWRSFTFKMNAWLVNSPLSINHYSELVNEDSTTSEFSASALSVENTDRTIHQLELEQIIEEIFTEGKLNDIEIIILLAKYEGKTIEQIMPLINKGKTQTGEAINSTTNKAHKILQNIFEKYPDDFTLEELMEQFTISLRNNAI